MILKIINSGFMYTVIKIPLHHVSSEKIFPKNASIDLKVMPAAVREESDESWRLDGITGVNGNRKSNLCSFSQVMMIPVTEILL